MRKNNTTPIEQIIENAAPLKRHQALEKMLGQKTFKGHVMTPERKQNVVHLLWNEREAWMADSHRVAFYFPEMIRQVPALQENIGNFVIERLQYPETHLSVLTLVPSLRERALNALIAHIKHHKYPPKRSRDSYCDLLLKALNAWPDAHGQIIEVFFSLEPERFLETMIRCMRSIVHRTASYEVVLEPSAIRVAELILKRKDCSKRDVLFLVGERYRIDERGIRVIADMGAEKLIKRFAHELDEDDFALLLRCVSVGMRERVTKLILNLDSINPDNLGDIMIHVPAFREEAFKAFFELENFKLNRELLWQVIKSAKAAYQSETSDSQFPTSKDDLSQADFIQAVRYLHEWVEGIKDAEA